MRSPVERSGAESSPEASDVFVGEQLPRQDEVGAAQRTTEEDVVPAEIETLEGAVVVPSDVVISCGDPSFGNLMIVFSAE